NNNFTYYYDSQNSANQTCCLFTAHTRKMFSQANFTLEDRAQYIICASIPYGPK
ncbi:hypothetical protein DFS33DRAFT_1246634, partial [Desarmillaria ectypa]